MNKTISLPGVVITLFLSVNLFAESPDLGFVSSMAIPFYSGNGWSDYQHSLMEEDSSLQTVEGNPLIGVSLGLVSEYSLNRDFSIRGGLIFSASGGGYVEETEDYDRSSRLITEYNLDVPLFLKWYFHSRPPGILYLVGGPQISFLLYQMEYEQDGAEFHSNKLDRNQFQPLGFGFAGGLGTDVPEDNYTIYLELMFLREITSSFSTVDKVYQTAVSLNTGIRWKRGIR